MVLRHVPGVFFFFANTSIILAQAPLTVVVRDSRFHLDTLMSFFYFYFIFITIFLSGHGQHLTGLGHVKDLARAMANVLGKECAIGQVYNVQVGVVLQPP